MKYIFIIFLSIIFHSVIAQEDSVYLRVDSVPHFPGGDEYMYDYIEHQLTYLAPSYKLDTIRKYGYQALVSFVVTKEGDIINFHHDYRGFIETSRNMDDRTQAANVYLVDELQRIFYEMPRWHPGYIQGEAVNTEVYLMLEIGYFYGGLEIAYRPLYPDSIVYGQVGKQKYQFRDFVKVGAALVVIVGIIALSSWLNNIIN